MLSEPELEALLLDVQQRFAWEQTAPGYRLERVWPSRTATLYLAVGRADGTPSVVLKVLAQEGEAGARALDERARAVSLAWSAQDRSASRIVPALGWTPDPPAVCSPFIDGMDVIRLFADLANPFWGTAGVTPDEVAALCGRTLAQWHALDHPEAVGDPDVELVAAARAMRVSGATLARLRAAATTAPAFGDFGPHQFMIAPDGALFLLDLPATPVLAPVQADVGRFLFGLDKALARNPGRGAARRAALRGAFLEDYRDTAATGALDGDGALLVRMFEGVMARGIARQRWSIGRRREALRYGRAWVGGVRALRG